MSLTCWRKLAHELVVDLALLVEVEVERPLGDAGGARDVVDGGGVITLLAEDVARGGDELGAPLVAQRRRALGPRPWARASTRRGAWRRRRFGAASAEHTTTLTGRSVLGDRLRPTAAGAEIMLDGGVARRVRSVITSIRCARRTGRAGRWRPSRCPPTATSRPSSAAPTRASCSSARRSIRAATSSGSRFASRSSTRSIAKAAEAGLDNLRAVFCNINVDLPTLVPDASLTRVFVNFPDPWFKRRHQKRRLVNDELVDGHPSQAASRRASCSSRATCSIWRSMPWRCSRSVPERFANVDGPWSFARDNAYGAQIAARGAL